MKIREVEEIVRPILKNHGVRKAGLFGSLVHGKHKQGSDVDVLIEVDDNISLLGLASIKNELEDKLGRRVDLVEYETIKPLIRQRILHEQVIIL